LKLGTRPKGGESGGPILEIRICFETGDPPVGWGVRRTNFDIRISDLCYTLFSVVKFLPTCIVAASNPPQHPDDPLLRGSPVLPVALSIAR